MTSLVLPRKLASKMCSYSKLAYLSQLEFVRLSFMNTWFTIQGPEIWDISHFSLQMTCNCPLVMLSMDPAGTNSEHPVNIFCAFVEISVRLY